jgi:hypothetical protein
MGGLLTIAIMGSGRYSLDNALAARERSSFDLYERFRTNLR